MKNMKNLVILLICFLLSNFIMNCKAQNNFPQDGDNIVNNHINKFVGTWYWSSGNNSFQLILKIENIKDPYININFYYDTLIGFHKFVSNGTVIENSTQYSYTNFSNKNWTVLGNTSNNNPNWLHGTFRHASKNKSVKFEIEYIDANHIKLVKLQNTRGIKFRKPTDPPFDGTITLPQNIILTKQ